MSSLTYSSAPSWRRKTQHGVQQNAVWALVFVIAGVTGIAIPISTFAAIVPLAAIAFLLLLLRPMVAAKAAILLLPLQGVFILTFGAHFAPSELLMLPLIAAVVAARAMGRGNPTLRSERLPCALPLAVLTVVVVVSTVQMLTHLSLLQEARLVGAYTGGRSSPQLRSLITAGWMIYSALSLYAVYRFVDGQQRLATLLRLSMWSASAAAVYGAFQGVALQHGVDIHLPGTSAGMTSLNFPVTRSYGTFTEAATFGAFMLAVLPITLGLLLEGDGALIRRRELLAHAVLQAGGLVASFSVGQWLSFAAWLLAMPALSVFVSPRLAWRGVRVWVAGMLFGAVSFGVLAWIRGVGFAAVVLGFQTKLGGHDDSLAIRTQLAHVAVRIFRDNPLFGVGIGDFPFVGSVYAQRMALPVAEQNHLLTPANVYLVLLAETGVVGIAALVAVGIAVLRAFRNALARVGPGFQRGALIGLLGSLVAIAISNNFLDNLFVLTYWVIGGMALAAVRLAARPEGSSLEPS